MLIVRSILSKFSILMLVLSIMLFMSGCSEDNNPLTSDAESGFDQTSGFSDITFITGPQAKQSLEKIVTDAEMIYRSQGGELSLSCGNDFEYMDMIMAAPHQITAWEVDQALLNVPYLSAKVLQTICENTGLRDDYFMYNILLRNAPLRECVLETMIDNNFFPTSFNLKEILVASSPLPQSILGKLNQSSLNEWDRGLVLAAQSGQRMDESSYNNAGGGLDISLKILPWSIPQNTYISMSTDDAYLMGDVYLTFGPHGTLFNPPALLTFKASGLDLSGINPDLVNIFYVNEDTGLWELMPSESITVDVEAGYIEVINAEFSHFSRYAIGMR